MEEEESRLGVGGPRKKDVCGKDGKKGKVDKGARETWKWTRVNRKSDILEGQACC
jgi:hypothetical protein